MNRLLVLGLLLVAAGIVLVACGAVGQGNVSTGGFVLIGPFPVVFGTGSNGGELALLSVLLGVLMIILLFMMASRFRTPTHEGEEETNK